MHLLVLKKCRGSDRFQSNIDRPQYLVLGPADTGKSCRVRKIAEELNKIGKNVQLTGKTGIASSLLYGIKIHKFVALKDDQYTSE